MEFTLLLFLAPLVIGEIVFAAYDRIHEHLASKRLVRFYMVNQRYYRENF